MKYDEGATKGDKRMAIILCVIFSIIALLIIFLHSHHGTGELAAEPNETLVVNLNDTFNISFSTRFSNMHKCLVNDIDMDDVESYEPYISRMIYSEGNYTNPSNETEFVQNWTFLANRIGSVNLYFDSEEYKVEDNMGNFHYNYWVRVEVVV